MRINPVVEVLLVVPVLLLSIVLHEWSHGVVSTVLGDPTPRQRGRLTLNPLKHLDPLGTFLPVVFYILRMPVFGWAKPVPIDPYYYKNRRLGIFLTGAAGPLMNFLLAALAVKLGLLLPANDYLAIVIRAAIGVNIILGLFNLIPIPPLDGSRVLQLFLPRKWLYGYFSLEPYGFFIIIAVMVFFPQANGLLRECVGWIVGLLLTWLS